MMRRERNRRSFRRASHGGMYSLDAIARAMENEHREFKAGNPRNLDDLVSYFAEQVRYDTRDEMERNPNRGRYGFPG